MSTATASFLVHNRPPLATLHFNSKPPRRRRVVAFSPRTWPFERIVLRTGLVCGGARRNSPTTASAQPLPEGDGDGNLRRVLQFSLWVAEGIYILWLFLLPYAPGDPVWAISSDTINSLVGLSLNFFFILPLMNSAFLIPYMAIRLDSADAQNTPTKSSQLASVMTNGAPVVGLIGGAICLISTLWALFGRPDGNFGGIADRWDFLVSYIGSERLAYAFIWDICLYTIFQPWLIGDNIQNVQKSKVNIANYLRFVPVVGLVVYLVCLNLDEEV
ncbi:hypothetical protein TEA_001329 [Camellia sinensis var. sinensis]|uniref:Uncharacterized protein n=1 Tax=Camellia sinensis var. sinensis TaxID=542762 RepID=A0A4S4DGH3_CAMSN|nr:hypothetical protein TEA_001329 [Camellia sinensis var. sinensis]